MLAALALLLCGGCNSLSHPARKSKTLEERQQQEEMNFRRVPNGEESPFGPPPSR
jgi:hypothetical protein